MRIVMHGVITFPLLAGLACTVALLFKQSPTVRGNAVGRSEARTYVAASECAACHGEIAASYAKTGMARSVYPADQDIVANALKTDVVYYHRSSHTWFSMERRDGRLYQRRWQRNTSGEMINEDSEAVDYVVGSGDHVRTYLHRGADGTMMEFPLAWYAEGGGSWGPNPGFDNAAPPTRHPISYGCIFCHDSYPQLPSKLGDSLAHPVYIGALPSGIDCQRCHGPGSDHVRAASTPGVSLETVRATILNPKRLDKERQMEVCMQCHLEITSFHLPDHIRRYDQQPFGYTPDKPLASFLEYFQPDLKSKPDPRFDIDSAPYRLRQSQCFLRSQEALTCELCHDPHEPHQTAKAEQRYVAACLGCHTSRLSSLVSDGKHTKQTDCIGCHMPQRRTDDVVHAVITDHLIQRVAPPPSVRLNPKREIIETTANIYRGEVIPYRFGSFVSDDDGLYTATAQVMHDSNSKQGIDRLAELIKTRVPGQAEFTLELGDALQRAGRTAEALDAYRNAVRIDQHSLRARRSLGAALSQSGQLDEALKVLTRGLEDYPEESLLMYEVGRVHLRQQRLPQAIEYLTKATKLDPQLAEGYNELGIALAQSGDTIGAASAFRESLRIAPYESGVSRNLEMLTQVPVREKR